MTSLLHNYSIQFYLGNIIQWNHQIRLRHMTTRQYLSITTDGKVTLTTNGRDPNSVFLMHPVIKVHLISPSPNTSFYLVMKSLKWDLDKISDNVWKYKYVYCI